MHLALAQKPQNARFLYHYGIVPPRLVATPVLVSSHRAIERSTMAVQDAQYKVSATRWLVLTNLSITSMTNTFLMFMFVAIYQVTMTAFYTDTTGVNTIVNSMTFVYFPASIIGLYLNQRWGLRVVLITAAVLNAMAAILHYVAIKIPATSRYPVLLFGTFCAGAAQPLVFNTPSLISAVWFPAHERDIATTVGSLTNTIGNALASAIPPLIVNTVSDLESFLGWTALAVCAQLIMAWFLALEKPLSPPSAAAAAKIAEKEGISGIVHLQAQPGQDDSIPVDAWQSNMKAVESVGLRAALSQILAEYGAVASNRNFLQLAVGFGIVGGLFNALMAVLAQLMEPCGFDATVAGAVGAVILTVGLVSAAVVCEVIKCLRTGHFVFMRMAIVLGLGSFVFFLSSLRPGQDMLLYVSSGMLGALLMPCLPVTLEIAAELTYPAPEDVSAGFMLNIMFLVQLVVLYVMGPLISMPATQSCTTVATPAAGLIVACFLVAGVCMGTVKTDYRRKAAEKSLAHGGALSEEDGKGEDGTAVVVTQPLLG